MLGAAFSEEQGGLGGGALENAIIMEELGKVIAIEPYLPTVVIAGGALKAVGGAQADAMIPRIIDGNRSEEHTSEIQSLMRISYAVFCLKKKKHTTPNTLRT